MTAYVWPKHLVAFIFKINLYIDCDPASLFKYVCISRKQGFTFHRDFALLAVVLSSLDSMR
jgi:hypothetical protein